MGRLNAREAVAALDELAEQKAHDPEVAHNEADAVLLKHAHKDVVDAYLRVMDACDWWAHA